MANDSNFNRRELVSRLLRSASLTGAVFVPGLLHATTRPLALTPQQAEGPFYPGQKPDGPSNDLYHGSTGRTAEGTPMALSGHVMDSTGAPLPGAMVEIWQCDNRAIYRHPRAARQGSEDPNFSGYGEVRAGVDGAYRFVTIVPVSYPGRPPHIHAKIKRDHRELLTTQLYVPNHPDNDADGLLSMVYSRNRDRLIMQMTEGRISSGERGQLAEFDFVVES